MRSESVGCEATNREGFDVLFLACAVVWGLSAQTILLVDVKLIKTNYCLAPCELKRNKRKVRAHLWNASLFPTIAASQLPRKSCLEDKNVRKRTLAQTPITTED